MRSLIAVLMSVLAFSCTPGSIAETDAGRTGGGTATGGGSATGGGMSTGGGGATGGGGGTVDAGYLPDPTVTGNILHVCPTGCTYALPSGALAAAVDGDTIEIAFANYVDCSTVTKDNVIIRGVLDGSGARPKVGGKVCGRKGIFVVQSSNVLIENLELADAVDPTTNDQNWACIRYDSLATARNLKIRNVYFHDADNGLLGNGNATAPNVLLIEDSLFERLGRAGYAHGMYVGTSVTQFVLRNSIVRSNHDDGHLVKSRALQNIIECNTISGLNGRNSYAVDLPQGGDAIVRKNVIQQGPMIGNSGNFMINFAEENGDNAPHSLVVQNTYFVNDFTNQGRINVAIAGTATPGWAQNTYVGAGGSMTLVNSTGAPSFTNFANRAAASLPAYDGTVASLPPTPRCP